ncbi:unnamed protein product [Notodromas monacha]|uniref:Uridine kinase n=1 Tax=Notodromas monacha TaxID=399045 RepID=A0A7R9BEA4_9CRUS|nr:unnamed protein product [Notodromas monacha]CAG0913796.1 unnamed protein product [Notodromas monacha]
MPPALDGDENDSGAKLIFSNGSSRGEDDEDLSANEKMSSKSSTTSAMPESVSHSSVGELIDARNVRRAPHRHLSPSPSGRNRQRTSSMSQLSGSTRTAAPEPLIRALNRTIYTAGRPPWYDSDGQLAEPCFIGICGGSASGKTTVAKAIIEALHVPWVTLLSMDSFYKILTPEQSAKANNNEYNFDHPDAFDFDLLCDTLIKLKEGKKVEVPIYNFLTHSREEKTKTMYGANVVIFEGIMSFHHPGVLRLLDVKVFVDTDSDIRLARRLERDIAQRGRDLQGVLSQYERFVKPAYDFYIAPLKSHADIVVPRGGENEVAINVTVETAIGIPYKGKAMATENICGVSIVRAGETMEQALTDVLKDVRIGKILIQTNLETGEAELYYLRLPDDIKDYHIMVMDATVATGAAAMMAIRILLDHDVPEENILLLSLLMAKIGVQTIAYAFPRVKILTTAIDDKVNDQFYVEPGIGNFGDRYYGTEPGPALED